MAGESESTWTAKFLAEDGISAVLGAMKQAAQGWSEGTTEASTKIKGMLVELSTLMKETTVNAVKGVSTSFEDLWRTIGKTSSGVDESLKTLAHLAASG